MMATIGLRVGEIVGLKMASPLKEPRSAAHHRRQGWRPLHPHPGRAPAAARGVARGPGDGRPDEPLGLPTGPHDCLARFGNQQWGEAGGAASSPRPISASSARRLGKEAGVERATNPHVFRHTAATGLLDAGYTLAEVQTILGHANIATTFRLSPRRPGPARRTDAGLRRRWRSGREREVPVPRICKQCGSAKLELTKRMTMIDAYHLSGGIIVTEWGNRQHRIVARLRRLQGRDIPNARRTNRCHSPVEGEALLSRLRWRVRHRARRPQAVNDVERPVFRGWRLHAG